MCCSYSLVCTNPLIFSLSLAVPPSQTHTHKSAHTRVCCAGKPNDQAEKTTGPEKEKSVITLAGARSILLCEEAFLRRCPHPHNTPHPTPPPTRLQSRHYVVAPALPTRFSSSLFSAVCKKEERKESWAPHQKEPRLPEPPRE